MGSLRVPSGRMPLRAKLRDQRPVVTAGGIGQKGLEGDADGPFVRGVLLRQFVKGVVIRVDLRVEGRLFCHPFAASRSGRRAFGRRLATASVTTIRALAPGAEITVFSYSPVETRQVYGVKAVNRWNPFGVIWALLRSDLLLSGGGGLLQDVTGVRSICYYLVVVALALAVGKPVVYYAQGVGPVRTRFGRWLTRIVSNRVDLITVRDQASRDDLLAMGICRPPLVVTADPVLALNPSQLNNAGGAELLEALRLQARLEGKNL